jgi:hypothetical protein
LTFFSLFSFFSHTIKKLFSTQKNRITGNGGRGAEGIVEFVSGEGFGVGGVA